MIGKGHGNILRLPCLLERGLISADAFIEGTQPGQENGRLPVALQSSGDLQPLEPRGARGDCIRLDERRIATGLELGQAVFSVVDDPAGASLQREPAHQRDSAAEGTK
ncbi:MAG: hypothetical protein ABI831_08585 [Betaproteobacteria bacterium]